MPQNGKCVWVERAAAPGVTPIYCHKPTRYHMRMHDNGTKYRDYNNLCDKHEQEFSNLPPSEDDE